jgi:hypothetical protein
MSISEIALVGATVLLGLALVLIIIFGFKNIITGKHELTKIIVVLIPFVIFGVTYGVTGQATESALTTFLILVGSMLLMILLGGIRSSFKF